MAMDFTLGGLGSSVLGGVYGLSAFAEQQVNAANSFVVKIAEAVDAITPPTISAEFPTGGMPPAIQITQPPEVSDVVWSLPGVPTAFTEVLETGDLGIEPFDESPPEMYFGSAPADFAGHMPDAPGVNLAFEDPELVLNLPAPPSLLSLNVTQFGGMNLPTFDAETPELVAVEPTIREYVPGQQYTSSLLEGLRDRLQRNLEGGTGLGLEAETAIWDRGREREARAQAEALLQIEEMEALGYARPPGGYMAARTKIITETDYAVRGHSREVMIESARLELDQIKHSLTTAVQLESKLIDYTNSTEQRLFEASRYATEAGVTIYNAKVQAFGAMVDVYRSKVQGYQALIQAETAKVEAYRAQIAAEQAKADINKSLVEQYRVQSEVALSAVEVYKARIAAIQAKADIEKTKVEVFGAQVQGYTAQVNAYTAGVEGFRARISAEASKQEAFKSRVQAFAARVDASAKIIDARVAAYRGRIEGKTAEYEGYKATIAAESARVDALSKISGVRADIYRARTAAESAYAEALIKQWQAVLDQNQRTSEIAVNAAKANAELYVTTRSLGLDAAKAGAQVMAQIGAAALNTVNFSATASSSESTSQSESVVNSYSTSWSQSTSSSNNQNYNYSV